MPLDNTLPFLVALKIHHPDAKITLVSSEQNFRSVIEAEPFLRDTVLKYGIAIWSSSAKSSTWARRLSVASVIWKIAIAAFTRRIVLVNSSKLAKWQRGLKWLMVINRHVHRGLTMELDLVPSSSELDRFMKDALNKNYQRTMSKPVGPICDVFVTSLPESAYVSLRAALVLHVGYGRGFQSWIDEVKNSLTGIDPAIQDNFIFWPLSVLTRQEKTQTIDLRPMIQNTLKIIMKVGFKSQIVFRYHPTTDREQFGELISQIGFQNYVITSAHPHQLMQKCCFVFSNSGSSLFSDAYFFKKPVVQYTPTSDSFCIADSTGRPVASIFQPVVTRFFSSESEFAHFLSGLGQYSNQLAVNRARDENQEYAPIDRLAERSLFAAIFEHGN